MADHDHPQHGHHVDFDSPAMAAHAEREGAVFLPVTTSAIDRVAEECTRRGVTVRRVTDLGSGPGVGTCVLAERFPHADVVAADGSATMLASAAARIAARDLGGRVRTRRLDVPDGITELEPAEVIWASLVLHHVGDEVAALRQIKGALQPGGLLALLELDGPPHVVVSDVNRGGPDVGARIDSAWRSWFDSMRAELPGSVRSSPYTTMLETAGYEVLVDEVLTLEVAPPFDHHTAGFVRDHLVRSRELLEQQADATGVAALDLLIGDEDADGWPEHNDVALRATRHLFVARPHSAS